MGINNKRPARVSNELAYLRSRVYDFERRNKELMRQFLDNEVKVGLLKSRIEELSGGVV